MNTVKIDSRLKRFKGTSGYHKHLYPGKSPILLTDGCKYVRDTLDTNWLFDTIVKYQADPRFIGVNFQVWEILMHHKDYSWSLTCKNGIDGNPIISIAIDTPDFKFDYLKIWLIGTVALLPTEY